MGGVAREPEQSAIVRALLGLYARGMFPMGEPGSDDLYLHDPDPRAIIPLDGRFHVPRSLAQRVRSGRYTIRTNTAFERVVRECAEPRPTEGGGTWITDEVVGLYTALHRAGHAHSVEAWLVASSGDGDGPGVQAEPVLVGGLYGVHLNGLFAGESMFSRPERGGTDASKVCLVHLVAHLRARGFTLLDTQFTTPHLRRFGAIEVPRTRYRSLLRRAMGVETSWEPFEPELLVGPKTEPRS
ncbi:MAG: leucyl/phenylalanyl-tRNA--protein transferase [Phycisphaerales bacterium]|nr:leucyl/phenylalanyl-tRNA--protein transferase [Phycisphaerales bacterium]